MGRGEGMFVLRAGRPSSAGDHADLAFPVGGGAVVRFRSGSGPGWGRGRARGGRAVDGAVARCGRVAGRL